MPRNARFVPVKIPVWTPSPDAIDSTSSPWAIGAPNGPALEDS